MAYDKPNSNVANFNFIEEGYVPSQADQANFNFTLGITRYYILAGASNNFVAVWADLDASLTNSKMYVASVGNGAAFSIVDLKLKETADYYTTNHAGACGESLDAEDIVDTNVTM